MFENDNSATTTIINNMHEEIQVALNFLISFLYNKLPRRRVNQFGEELELILKKRFIDHWYPLEPSKGSAYRCIHCNPQLDSSLFREAAQKSGLNLQDVQQNFPNELSIWIDPGEVSYRINEKGPVNILFSLNKQRLSLNNNNGESTTTTTTPIIINGLNPEAQCFQPESKHFIINNDSKLMINHDHHQSQLNKSIPDIFNNHHNNNNNNNNSKNDAITFTTAAFAATKFGSTKPKVMMANRKQQQQQFQQQQQTRSIPIDGPKFLTTTNATATNANRKFHFKPVSRANSFSNSSSSNGQTFSHCHPSLTSPLSSSQQQSHSGSDLLTTVMNNLAIVNQNRHNGQSQQILNNQQQQKMRQLMQWNNNNNEIKSAFDRDQQQQCMLGLFEQQQQPQMQRNSFDVFPPNSSNMNWNQTNQSNGGIQRSISMISDHGNDYNNGVGGNNLLLETFMPDKLLREIFEIGNNDDDQDHNHDDSNDNLLMMFNQNQSPPELISPTLEIPFGLSSTTTTTTLPPLLSSSCWSSSSAVESSNNSNNNSSSITPQSLSSSSLLLNILNEFDNLSLNSTSESSSIGSIASYVQ